MSAAYLDEREKRRNPERILQEVNGMEQIHRQGRGRLKIFFGYAAGVGKTYAMLVAARMDQEAGKDLAVGYVEPHARPDTMALLDGLPRLMPMETEHRGIILKEFDLDAALMRRPEIILVDELAHTNAEGCRHKKRWQDVQELLDAGIDVYTTVNVQHLESLHDIVAAITHVRVSERVPDRLFDEADKIELVDIEPETLLARMEAGKIYKKEQADRALGNFFNIENLTALREIALRRTADQVNRAVMWERQAGGRDYYTGEHVLVCISAAPSNARVIRTAARMSYAFRARFSAVVVEPPVTDEEREKFRQGVEENIALAKQFGAGVVILYGEEIALQITEYAKLNGVSKIVIGRSVHSGGIRGLLSRKKNLIDQMIALAPGMDLYVIPDIHAQAQKKTRKKSRIHWEALKQEKSRILLEMASAAGLLSIATITGMILERWGLGEANLVMVYMLAVIVIAGFSRYRLTGGIVSAVSVLFYNFFFTDPRYTLRTSAPLYDPFTFLTMLSCALLVSFLAERLKNQVRLVKEESRKMQILIAFSNRLKLAADGEAILTACAEQVVKLLGKNVIMYDTIKTGATTGQVFLREGAPEEARLLLLSESEMAVAAWVKKNCHKAGCSTDTLPGATGYYLPVQKDGRVFGVIGIELEGRHPVGPNDKNLLHVLLDETAVTVKSLLLHRDL